ncbi:small basic family protein [Texcoconibacillus texcoconensis]|nr:DUF1290 domain-containing protein [Texcoconibacillus texcoconensis]
MWLPFIGLFIGVILGIVINVPVADFLLPFVAVGLLVCIDTLVGGLRAHLEKAFDEQTFFIGFVFNLLLALTLAFLGAQLGVDLYLAAVIPLGIRLFKNVASIRKKVLKK